ncbi:hypothetical protein XENORESO_015786, partial [Xenotaenia resolanae]
EVGYLKEVKLTAAILRSALYCSDECKVVAMDARLTLTLSALWPWLLLDDSTMEAVLELLCVYTANFHPVRGRLPVTMGTVSGSIRLHVCVPADSDQWDMMSKTREHVWSA